MVTRLLSASISLTPFTAPKQVPQHKIIALAQHDGDPIDVDSWYVAATLRMVCGSDDGGADRQSAAEAAARDGAKARAVHRHID